MQDRLRRLKMYPKRYSLFVCVGHHLFRWASFEWKKDFFLIFLQVITVTMMLQIHSKELIKCFFFNPDWGIWWSSYHFWWWCVKRSWCGCHGQSCKHLPIFTPATVALVWMIWTLYNRYFIHAFIWIAGCWCMGNSRCFSQQCRLYDFQNLLVHLLELLF